MIFIVAVFLSASIGLKNFKLDASSDALVLENDESLKTYREAEDEFGDSSFLIVTYEPNKELFSDYSINRIANLENDLKKLIKLEPKNAQALNALGYTWAKNNMI